MSDSVRGEVVSEAMRVGRELALRYVSGQAPDTASIVNLTGITSDEMLCLYSAALQWRDKILDEMRVAFLAREAIAALDVLEETLSALDRHVESGETSSYLSALSSDVDTVRERLVPLLGNPLIARFHGVLAHGYVTALNQARRELHVIAERGTVTEPEGKGA